MTLIPEIKKLKHVNASVYLALKNFPMVIEQWRLRLKTIGPYATVACLNNLRMHIEDQRETYDTFMLAFDEQEHSINCLSVDKSVEKLAEEGVVLIYSTYACVEQYAAGNLWPDSISDQSTPHVLVAEFSIEDKAKIRIIEEAGNVIWDEPEFEGSWQEVFDRLVDMQEIVRKKLDHA